MAVDFEALDFIRSRNKQRRAEAIKKEKIKKLKDLIEKDMETLSKTKNDYDNSVDDPAIQKLIMIRWSNEIVLCAKKIEELKKYE
jgi:hypothetical protein